MQSNHVVFLVGLPGIGKSTYVAQNIDLYAGYEVILYDEVANAFGHERQLSRDQVSALHMQEVDKIFETKIQEALEKGKNIIIEKPYLTVESRRAMLESAKKHNYRTTAVVIAPPDEETHIARLLERDLIKGRIRALNYVSLNEFHPPVQGDGEFDEIIPVGTPSEKPLFYEYKKNPSLESLIEGARDWAPPKR